MTNTYLTPIAAAISARGLTNQINYIGTIGQATCYSITPSRYAGHDGEFAQLRLEPADAVDQRLGVDAAKRHVRVSSARPRGSTKTPSNIPIGSNPAIPHSASYNVYYPDRQSDDSPPSITCRGRSATRGPTATRPSPRSSPACKAPSPPTARTRRAPSTSRTTATSAPPRGDAEWSTTESQLDRPRHFHSESTKTTPRRHAAEPQQRPRRGLRRRHACRSPTARPISPAPGPTT